MWSIRAVLKQRRPPLDAVDFVTLAEQEAAQGKRRPAPVTPVISAFFKVSVPLIAQLLHNYDFSISLKGYSDEPPRG